MRSPPFAVLVFAAACAIPAAAPPSRGVGSASAPATVEAPDLSWATARHEARAALEAHDYASYRRALESLYARSKSPWVLVELSHADVLLGEPSRANFRTTI